MYSTSTSSVLSVPSLTAACVMLLPDRNRGTHLGREAGWLSAVQTLVPRPPAQRVQAQGRELQALVTACHVGTRQGEGLEPVAAGAVVWQVGDA